MFGDEKSERAPRRPLRSPRSSGARAVIGAMAVVAGLSGSPAFAADSAIKPTPRMLDEARHAFPGDSYALKPIYYFRNIHHSIFVCVSQGENWNKCGRTPRSFILEIDLIAKGYCKDNTIDPPHAVVADGMALNYRCANGRMIRSPYASAFDREGYYTDGSWVPLSSPRRD